ncbi:MAG: PQQ-dependent sugar dehydrogenase, partial [Pseudomonadota bacterium]
PKSLRTQLYQVEINALPVPSMRGNGGAVASWGNRLVLALRSGEIHIQMEDGSFARLDVAPVLDLAAQDAAKPNPGYGVKALEVEETDGGLRLYVSHTAIDTEKSCFTMTLSSVDVSLDSGAPVADGAWRDVWASAPCMPAETNPFPLAAGGAMDITPDGRMLLSVGDFAFDGVDYRVDTLVAQDDGSDYGKVVEIDLDTGEHTRVAKGMRNSSGLLALGDGRVFEVEHGYRGGDELNQILPGGNYGWPLDTYGTVYSTYEWPHAEELGRHDRFDKPMFAWSPSIAVSAMAEAAGDEFPLWENDLLVGSLKAFTLHRVVIAEGRVILVEPIKVGARIRDMTVLEDGRIVLMLDAVPYLGVLTRGADPSKDDLAEIPQVMVQCRQCHAVHPTDLAGSAPRIHGMIKRYRVAQATGFDYSPALLEHRGKVWTEDLMVSYLMGELAPGSSMPLQGLTRSEAREVVEYLTVE